MGKGYDSLTPDVQAWLAQQKLFFVATAPLDGRGHVNCSPKGGDTFRVIGEREVAYLDLTGSGVETIAHLQENGRIVLMFCAFEGAPRIVRLHGKGRVVYPEAAEYAALAGRYPPHPGARAVICVQLTRISDSCGFGVPLLAFLGERETLERWAEKEGTDGVAAYRRKKNRTSIDGMPGYRHA